MVENAHSGGQESFRSYRLGHQGSSSITAISTMQPESPSERTATSIPTVLTLWCTERAALGSPALTWRLPVFRSSCRPLLRFRWRSLHAHPLKGAAKDAPAHR